MVPNALRGHTTGDNSPRIRGDGPAFIISAAFTTTFSPYSRGWSPTTRNHTGCGHILPVFAGMVPVFRPAPLPVGNSPRIRGDGPQAASRMTDEQ